MNCMLQEAMISGEISTVYCLITVLIRDFVKYVYSSVQVQRNMRFYQTRCIYCFT